MGNPALRRIADPVENPQADAVARLAADMRETLEAIDANGLAAPQVEVGQRLFIYRVPANRIPPGARQEPVPWTALVNPILEPLSEAKTLIWERCLSLPGLYGYVPRHDEIRLTWHDLDGVRHERIARGFHAMLIQHEYDHLDGMLYPMRMTDVSKLTFAAELGDGKPFYSYTPAEFDGIASPLAGEAGDAPRVAG
jgi:peptide deformylase